jgi:SET domain-containing protein 6
VELAELQASKVVNKIGKSSAEDTFSKSIAPLGLVDYNIDKCHKVASIIMSYAFDVPETHATEEEEVGEEGDDLVSDDEKTILSMIPLADMLCVYSCTLHGPLMFKILLRPFVSYSIYHLEFVLTLFGSNADAERNNARLCCDNEELEMKSMKPIARGEEIFNDYGPLPRSDLLRRYGYITENYAQYDVAEITTQEFLPFFCSRQTFPDLNLPIISQEELDNRVGHIVGDRSGWDGVSLRGIRTDYFF